ASMSPARHWLSTRMPMTSTVSPARLSATMRRVSVEKTVRAKNRWIGHQTRASDPATACQAALNPALLLRISGCGLSMPQPILPARGSLLFLEPVAYAIKRFDHLEIVVDGFDFLPEPLDVAVDRAVVDINLVIVGRVH